MRKTVATALAAVTFVGAVAAAAPASADRRHYRHHHGGGNDEVAAAILGGVAGLALGAALSSGNRSNYSGSYYSGGYYDSGYRYDPRHDGYYGGGYYAQPRGYTYRTCVRTERFYDPYIGRNVKVRREYPC